MKKEEFRVMKVIEYVIWSGPRAVFFEIVLFKSSAILRGFSRKCPWKTAKYVSSASHYGEAHKDSDFLRIKWEWWIVSQWIMNYITQTSQNLNCAAHCREETPPHLAPMECTTQCFSIEIPSFGGCYFSSVTVYGKTELYQHHGIWPASCPSWSPALS